MKLSNLILKANFQKHFWLDVSKCVVKGFPLFFMPICFFFSFLLRLLVLSQLHILLHAACATPLTIHLTNSSAYTSENYATHL